MVYTDGIMALSEPEYGDDADIAVINSNSVKIDDHMTNAFNNLAEPFNPNKAYDVGEIVVYEKVTYIFTAAKSAGAWDATKVEVKPLGTAIFEKEGGGGSLSDLADTDIDTPAEGEVLTWDGKKWVNAEGTPAVTKTATGNPIEFEDGADAPLVKCVTAIQGNQDLHGYDKPWVGGAYINKMPPGEAKSTSSYGVTITSDGNGTYTFVGTCTQNLEVTFDCDNFTIPSADNSAFYLFNNEANANTDFVFYNGSTVVDSWGLSPEKRVVTYTEMGGSHCNKYGIRLKNDVTYNLTIKPMLAVGTSYKAWTPYSNICPITAYTEGEIEVSDGDGNATTHTTTYPSAIYRGSEDVVNGTVTTEWGMIASYAGETLSGEWISDRDEYAPGTTPTTGAQVAYELATPTTESVTPTNLPIKSLSGYNHIESSTGEMEVEYITQGYQPLVDLIQSSQHVYATAEQVVGKWWDGSTVYERTIDLGADITVNSSGYNITAFIPSDMDRSISCWGQCDTYHSSIPLLIDYTQSSQTWLIYSGILTIVRHLTIHYTKSTAVTRTISKGSTDSLKAEISEANGEGEELTTTDEMTIKKAQSEDTETKDDETEGNADEVQDETDAE